MKQNINSIVMYKIHVKARLVLHSKRVASDKELTLQNVQF